MKSNQIVDPVFGKLAWDSQLLRWCGESTFVDGTSFPLSVETLGYMTQRPPFEDATWDRTITQESREVLASVQSGNASIRRAVAEQCLSMAQDWNDGEPLDVNAVQSRLLLEAVELLPNGQAHIIFGDGGMFAGHALIAHVDTDGTVGYVEMFG
jgi:hypothetical protein